MPDNAPTIKRKATAALAQEIVQVGPASSNAKLRPSSLPQSAAISSVPPYNDEKIIAGQGHHGSRDSGGFAGCRNRAGSGRGGGMISGIATAIKLSKPSVKIIGVEPELAADAQASLRAGQIIQFPAAQVTRTMADGLRTQSVGAINFEHIRRYVDDIVTVTEDEIRQSMRAARGRSKTTAEPSGAVAVAAFLFHRDELPQTSINVAVISGGNIDPKMLAEIRS